MAPSVTIDLSELVRLVATGVVTIVGFLLANAYKKFAREHNEHGAKIQALEVRVAVLEDRGNAEHS